MELNDEISSESRDEGLSEHDQQNKPDLIVHIDIAAKINFAAHQSSFPLLKEISIENPDPVDEARDLIIELSSDQNFLKPKIWRMDRLLPGQRLAISDRNIELRGGFLSELADKIHAEVTVTVRHEARSTTENEEPETDSIFLVEERYPVEVLAFNEWGGANYMPELLAAFSMPNDPIVDKILKSASEILKRSGKSGSLDGYESRSRERVWHITAAIYNSIAKLGLSYAVPPASFEANGQKIRLASNVVSGRIATCLDTTMLFSSCLEQIGLNPVIVMPKDHALIGVWLQPEQLSSIVIDDAEIIRKRCQLKEIIVVETTYLSQDPPPPFSMAITHAENLIAEQNDPTFHVAIDIKRARDHRITPLGLRVTREGGATDDTSTIIELPVEEAPSLPDFDAEQIEEKPDTPETRLDRWQRKLLDLSNRNPLLNYRSTKTSLKIICPDPGALEDKLADGEKIAIATVPTPTSQVQDEETHQQRTGENISEEYARHALQRKQVLVDLGQDQLDKQAVEIYRKAQNAFQEGGSNTLYLALGFLLWRRDDKQKVRSRAPLILLPVALERKSVRSGFRLSGHDDDPRFNTTLMEMLRRDFDIDLTGLDADLPEDDHGIDVPGIWDIVRRAVRDVPGFEVSEDVVLGHFSFAKYLMWKDLVDRADSLKGSSLVRHLMETPNDPYESSIDFVGSHQIDSYEPTELLAPLPADASQMSAVATADRGKDFIIIGPPGTGKSQTISNLITHLLGKRKTVLFVSEKMAALDVVHRRLTEIGVGKFCLELHSNKANKKDVLSRLGACWNTASSFTVDEWQREAEKLKKLRDRLNVVVAALHRKRSNGLTAHYAMGMSLLEADIAKRVDFLWQSAEQHDQTTLEAMRDTVEALEVQANAVGVFSDSPFSMVETGDWSPTWEQDFINKAEQCLRRTEELERAGSGYLSAIGLNIEFKSPKTARALSDLAETLKKAFKKRVAFALEQDAEDIFESADAVILNLEAYSEALKKLSCEYEPFAWRKIDAKRIETDWLIAQKKSLLIKFFAQRRILKTLREGGAKGKPLPEIDAKVLQTLRENGEKIEAANKTLSILKEWQALDSDNLEIKNIIELAREIRGRVGRLSVGVDDLSEIKSKVRKILEDANDLLSYDAPIGRAAEELIDAFREFEKSAGELAVVGATGLTSSSKGVEIDFENIQRSLTEIVQRRVELNNWCAWRRRRNQAIDMDLKPFVDGIEAGVIPTDDIQKTFEASYCKWWATQVISEDEVLRTFNKAEHENTIEAFRDTDDRFREATSSYVTAVLSGEIPSQDNVTKNSQWGVLQRELQKKQGHKPIRQLVEGIPEVMTKLAPCLMMSPLSVAQYLPTNQTLFDVVVFDEASQITVWDAVGAIARGKQTIIAGDPKQMPPTNFFGRSENDQDGSVDIEGDLESILDEMLGASIPQSMLNLHYRSRRESLIAFSNNRYYNDTLVTFPAPERPDNGVKLRKIEGHYSRGKGRTNTAEADAIVDEILVRVSHPLKKIREQSIGVVTFNAEQQSLILNKLDDARRKKPEIESFFSSDRIEPIFVKNLESVQGDERDVILFSITYGPDLTDHITMNFGPLNRQGGERRLNVAMTRARQEMIVFSSIRSEQFDLNRTGAEAVKDLKHFLEYAENGPSALAAVDHGSQGGTESPFETEVVRELRRLGWTVYTQIGVSSFRIDLGVLHPDHPGAYLAGVECDGAMYHSSAYARERDKIRQTVLEGLGWTLFRVWSTDWWINKAGALKVLDDALKEQLENDRERRRLEEEAEKEARMDAGSNSLEPEFLALEYERDADGEDETSPERPEAEDTTDIIELGPNEYTRIDLFDETDATFTENAHLPLLTAGLTDSAPHSDSKYTYCWVNFSELKVTPDPKRFNDDTYDRALIKMIDHVIDVEGPIHEHVLVRRIARAHNFQRAGAQINKRVLDLAVKRRGSTKEDVGRFFWQKGTVKDRMTQVRPDGRDEEMRTVDYICAEEIREIDHEFQLGQDAGAVGNRLGLQRVRESTRKRLEKILSSSPI